MSGEVVAKGCKGPSGRDGREGVCFHLCATCCPSYRPASWWSHSASTPSLLIEVFFSLMSVREGLAQPQGKVYNKNEIKYLVKELIKNRF